MDYSYDKRIVVAERTGFEIQCCGQLMLFLGQGFRHQTRQVRIYLAAKSLENAFNSQSNRMCT